MKSEYVIVWEFLPAPGRRADFEATYGSDGPWVALFRRAPGYLGNELAAAPADADWYRTVDRWVSAAAYQRFLEQYPAEYDELDRRCEELTQVERQVR